MVPPKHLGRFCLAAIVLCAVLMARWPGLEHGYAYLFRAGGNLLFSKTFWFWSNGRVHFIDLYAPDQAAAIERAVGVPVGEGFTPAKAEGVKDTLLILINRRLGESEGMRTSSRLVGYMPTAIIVVLVLATPLPLRRRGWALLWGLVLVQLFIAFRLTLLLLDGGFAAGGDVTLFHPGPFWRGALSNARKIVCNDPTLSWLFPVFIWFLVALRSRMWRSAESEAKRSVQSS